VVVGKANVDYLVRGPRLPAPGESINGDAFQEAAGGKGANQAVGAARLGAKVALVARVGRDARGDAVLAKLHDENVETRFVTRDPEAPTGVALCQVAASGEKQILALDLLRRGARIAAVQAGEHGDVLISREREVWLPRFDVNRLDATGAGDAFASALAVCLAEGRSLEDAGPFASAAAALATTVVGAQASLPRRETVLRLLSRC
jgi:sugar/nucleoside kinase (ribokinase family)